MFKRILNNEEKFTLVAIFDILLLFSLEKFKKS